MEENDNCGLIFRDFLLYHWRGLLIIFTPIVLLPIPILMKCIESNLVYVVIIMIVYWLFELIPPGFTGCIPVVLFPCLGIMGSAETCKNYMSDALYVFLGGMIIGLAFEHSGLHNRMALNILDMFGAKPPIFFRRFGIKSTIGAIDCTHIAIIAPASNNVQRPLNLYMNRKGFYSINVEAVCDHRLLFTFLNTKFPGATHDSGIWATSDLREHLIRSYNDSLLLGIIICTFIFSTILNNVAVTIMMCAIVGAVMTELEAQGICNQYMEPGPNDVVSKYAKKEDADPPKYPSSVTIGMYLGVAYAATVGGTLTLHGTVTNLAFSQFAKQISENYKKSENFDSEYFDKSYKYITSSRMISFNVIMMIIEILIIYLCLGMLHMGLFRSSNKPYAVKDGVNSEIKQKIKDLGSLSVHEMQVMIVFILMIVLLYTREMTPEIGWGKHVNNGKVWDSGVIVLIVFLMFIIPAHYRFLRFCFGKGPYPTKTAPSLVSWKMVHNYVHWGTLFLLGGAFAIGRAIEKTMQSKSFVENHSDFFESLSTSAMIMMGILIATALTQICSNVTAANIMIYYLRDTATLHHISPVDLLVPVGIACSIAFLLPVSTPPNNIVHHYAQIRTSKMFISGIIPTITLLLLLILFSLGWYGFVFGNIVSIPPPPPTTTAATITTTVAP